MRANLNITCEKLNNSPLLKSLMYLVSISMLRYPRK